MNDLALFGLPLLTLHGGAVYAALVVGGAAATWIALHLGGARAGHHSAVDLVAPAAVTLAAALGLRMVPTSFPAESTGVAGALAWLAVTAAAAAMAYAATVRIRTARTHPGAPAQGWEQGLEALGALRRAVQRLEAGHRDALRGLESARDEVARREYEAVARTVGDKLALARELELAAARGVLRTNCRERVGALLAHRPDAVLAALGGGRVAPSPAEVDHARARVATFLDGVGQAGAALQREADRAPGSAAEQIGLAAPEVVAPYSSVVGELGLVYGRVAERLGALRARLEVEEGARGVAVAAAALSPGARPDDDREAARLASDIADAQHSATAALQQQAGDQGGRYLQSVFAAAAALEHPDDTRLREVLQAMRELDGPGPSST